jgi:hypothetical protein
LGHTETAHRSGSRPSKVPYSRTSPNQRRAGKRTRDRLRLVCKSAQKARGCIISGSAAFQSRGAQRASRAMRWTGTQAHTQLSTHVKGVDVQSRHERRETTAVPGARRTASSLTTCSLRFLPSFLPYLLTYLLYLLILTTPPLLATCKQLAHLALATHC